MASMRPEHVRTLRVLWSALFSSTVMFLGVAVLVTRQRPEPLEPEPILLPALAAAALAAAVASVLVPRIVLAQGLRQLGLQVQQRAASDRMFDDSGRRPRRFVEPDQAKRRAALAYQTQMIVGMALAESVALMGFVTLFVGFPMTAAAAHFVVAWVLMLTKLPSERRFEQALERAYDADLS
jgi:hypothetical protein